MERPTDGGDDKVVSIITCFLLVTSTLAVIARLATKRAVSGSVNIDDGLVLSALVSRMSLVRMNDILRTFEVMSYWLWNRGLCARCERPWII